MAREAKLTIVIGKKGVGKTHATLVMIKRYLEINKRKVLILDTNNEFSDVKKDFDPSFPHIKALALQDVKRFTYSPVIEARRISVMKPEGGKMNLSELQDALGQILLNYENGLLLIEDINKFISDSLPSDLIGSIVTQRHVSVDVITHFQTISKALHPKIWGNANFIRWHQCEDFVGMQKAEFRTPIMYLTERLVERKVKQGDPRFHCYYDKEARVILGNFTKKEFRAAIEEYLQDNIAIVNKELARVDLFSGKKIHTDRKKCIESIINQYIKDYYGNKH